MRSSPVGRAAGELRSSAARNSFFGRESAKATELYKLAFQSRAMNQANRLFRRGNLQSGRVGGAVVAPYHRRVVHGYAVEPIGGKAVWILFCAPNNSPARAMDGKEGSR